MATNRKQQGYETKIKLFKAANTIIQEKGYDGLTVREIAKRAQTSTGNFYTHFHSKDDVLLYFFDVTINDYQKSHEIDPNLSGTDNFIRFYQWYATYLTKMGTGFCRAFYSTSNQSMGLKSQTNALMKTTKVFAQKFLEGFPPQTKINADYINKNVCIIAKSAIIDWCIATTPYNLANYCTELITSYLYGVSYQLNKINSQGN